MNKIMSNKSDKNMMILHTHTHTRSILNNRRKNQGVTAQKNTYINTIVKKEYLAIGICAVKK